MPPDPLPDVSGRSERPWALRMLGFLGALVLVAVGVSLMIRAELGVAPYDVLVTGFAETIGRSVGTASIILPVFFITAGVVLGGRIGVGTIVAMFFVGPVLNAVLDAIPDLDRMVVRIPVYAAGLVVVTTGIAGVVAARVGAGPVELFMLALHEQKGLPLVWVRTGIEAGCVAVGFVLGGQVGVGTLVFAVVVGPLLKRILRLMRYQGTPEVAADIGVASA